ncbi:MAG: phosphopantothenoylcysteine decarboxylase [Methanobacterium sp.]
MITHEDMFKRRGITNLSSGKTGVEIAREAFIRGADVTLICGRITANVPHVLNIINVESVGEMHHAVTRLVPDHHIFISAAAVSDFIPEIEVGITKISSSQETTIKLKIAPKIIGEVKKINPEIFLVGFKAEYDVSGEKLINSARRRMEESGADLMVANDVAVEGGGFGSEENEVIIIDEDVLSVPLSSKWEIARKILDRVVEKMD